MTKEKKEAKRKILIENFNMQDLENCIKHLYMEYPLFAHVMMNLERSLTNKIPTAGVSPDPQNPQKVHFIANPEFFGSLTFDERIGVIVHEMYHVIFGHFWRFSEEMKNSKTRDCANIAMDCAINQIIAQKFTLPPECITVQMVEKIAEKKLDKLETAEYYYVQMKKNVDDIAQKIQDMLDNCGGCDECDGTGEGKDGKPCDCGGSCDECDGTGEGKDGKPCDCASGLNKKLMKNIDNHMPHEGENPYLKKLVEQAIEKQQQRDIQQGVGQGDSVLTLIPKKEKMLDKKIWKKLVNKNFLNERSANSDFVYNKPSRRIQGSLYGKKRRIESSTVYVGIDTSGSITNEQLNSFINQINSAMKSENISINLIQCDWDISDIKMGLSKIKNKFNIHGRGGTDLTKIQDKILELEEGKKTRLVLLTDGYTDWRDEPSIITTCIYTNDHAKIENGIKHSAVLPI